MGYALAAFMQMHEKQRAIDHLFRDLVDRKYQDRGLSRNEWTVVHATVDCLSVVSQVSAKQQTRESEYWLLSESVYSMARLFNALANPVPQRFEHMEDCSEELKSDINKMRQRMRQRVADAIKPAVDPLLQYTPKKGHIMLSLMLDPR